jgi:hypothetical protein
MGSTTTTTTTTASTGPTNYSLHCFSYKLYEWDIATDAPVRAMTAQEAVNAGNADGPDYAASSTVFASVWDSQPPQPGVQPGVRQMHVRVKVEARRPATGNSDFDTRKFNAAQKIIEIVGLNEVGRAYGDRRILERTHAWFKAVKSAQYLKRQEARLTDPNDKADLDEAWDLAAGTVEMNGYYSTWLTVFKLDGGDAFATRLAQALDARAARKNSVYEFRGTNLVNSVTNMIPGM